MLEFALLTPTYGRTFPFSFSSAFASRLTPYALRLGFDYRNLGDTAKS
jgi:hypothetical protein